MIVSNTYGSLAAKCRPDTLDKILGQPITIKILSEQLKRRLFKNVYLFTGQTGIGKTTVARCFANAINNNIGYPIEIDAASNNSVEDARALVAAAHERALVGEYKIYIIDECHMLSTAAWNVLLKCLEECPKYTIFMLCTTEKYKVPKTIQNRAQCFNLVPIAPEIIKKRLEEVCNLQGFLNYNETCDFISKIVDGSLRTALNYLEQCADYSIDLSLTNAKQVLNHLSYEVLFKLTWAIFEQNEPEIINTIDTLFNTGYDLKTFIDWYLNFILDLLKYTLFNQNIKVTSIPEYLATENNAVVQYTVNQPASVAKFNFILDQLLDLKQLIKYDLNYKNTILIKFLQIARELNG